MSQREVIKIIRDYLETLIKSGYPVEKAFLYGSYARNQASPESDIDVMLVSVLFDHKYDDVVGDIWLIAKAKHERIEPYLVGKKRFTSDHVSPLLEIIRREGLEINA